MTPELKNATIQNLRKEIENAGKQIDYYHDRVNELKAIMDRNRVLITNLEAQK